MTTTFADGALDFQPGRIARIVLNAPHRRNAMTQAMWQGLQAACAQVAADPAIRVVVVTGAGNRAFCAGADIGEFGDVYATPESSDRYNRLVRAAQAALAALPQPTVAAIRGPCFGGGAGIALHCDLRAAAQDATFAVTPARMGLAYSPDDTAALIAAVGPARAREMLLTGRAIDAEQALAFGLIHHLHPEAELDTAVEAMAQALAALAPGALAAIKAIVSGVTSGADRAGLQATFDARFRTDEFREGAAAFLEKRTPRF